MKKIIGIAIFYLCCQTSFGQISIIFYSPQPNAHSLEFVSGTLNIQVDVISTYTLSGVTANVSGRQISLIFNSLSSLYEGSISLTGLSQGNLNVQVIANDIQGNQQIANQAFIYDIPALLIVDSPLSYSTATPLIHIKAKCIDSSGCTLNVGGDLGFGFSGLNINTGDSVDSVLDMSMYEGVAANIVFTATDTRGQRTVILTPILVENSHFINQVFVSNDQILDFNYNQVLISNPWWQGSSTNANDNNPYVFRTRIVNIITGDSTVIPYPGPLFPYPGPFGGGRSYLTLYGAIFITKDTDYLDSIFDWNGNSLYPLGPANSSGSLRVAGHYAIWNNDSILYLRNLQTVTNAIISSSAGNISNDVASNGEVAYWSNDYNIYTYSNNISTLLTNNSGNKWNVAPLTDGKNIVYTKMDPCCTNQNYSLHLYNGQTDTELSNLGMNGQGTFQMNNKYIAYSKPDSAGHLQIWLRDSLGASSQVTFSGNDCEIDLLSPNGDLIFISKNAGSVSRRYFANRSTGRITDISSSLGVTYYRDTTWYLTLGRILYKIDVTGSSNSIPIPSPLISGLDSSYCENQGMQKIKILNLPDTNTGIFSTVIMDGAGLSVAPDSSFSFNVTSMTAGKVEVKVIYSNANNTKTLTDTFTILKAVTPNVKVSSSTVIVTSLSTPIIITAVNEAGGGAAPLYTFASDRNFTTILQAEGLSNTISINPGTLNNGVNEIYARMKSSETCYTVQTNIDSVQVIRNTTTGILDPDFPNQPINVFPNPFTQTFNINGLSLNKIYVVIIHNASGKTVYQQQVSSATSITLHESALDVGTYWLGIYDLSKNKLIGTMAVLKE